MHGGAETSRTDPYSHSVHDAGCNHFPSHGTLSSDTYLGVPLNYFSTN